MMSVVIIRHFLLFVFCSYVVVVALVGETTPIGYSLWNDFLRNYASKALRKFLVWYFRNQLCNAINPIDVIV